MFSKLGYLLFLFFSFSVLNSQSLYHDPKYEITEGLSLNISVLVTNIPIDESNYSVKIFYRSINQSTYFQEDMSNLGNKYFYEIPETFIGDKGMEYFILLETSGYGMVSYPAEDPFKNPIQVKVLNQSSAQLNILGTPLKQNFGLEPNAQILSPNPDSKILGEDVLISLSYIKMDDLDIDKSKIYLDGIDITKDVNIGKYHLTYVPEKINQGLHEIKIHFYSLTGLQYNPIRWFFTVSTQDIIDSEKIAITQSGRLSTNLSSSRTDDIDFNLSELDGNYNLDFDWLSIRAKAHISSLQSIYEQPKNRYSAIFKTPYVKLMIGDIFPSFDTYSLSGNRVRGFNAKYTNKYFNLDFVTGEVLAELQGVYNESAMLISDSSTNPAYDASGNISNGSIILSRDNYTFQQKLSALRIQVTPTEKFNWEFKVVKTKDNIDSVSPIVPNSILTLTDEMVAHLSSDIFVDLDEDGTYSDGEFLWNSGETNTEYDVIYPQGWTDLNSLADFDTSLFLSYDAYVASASVNGESTYECDECECNIDGLDNDEDGLTDESDETKCNLLQKVWVISAKYENLDEIVDNFKLVQENQSGYPASCSDHECFGDYEIILSKDQWDGNKPQDNLVLSSNLGFNLDKNRLKINTGFSFSMLNENIWDPVLSSASLDTLGGDALDGKISGSIDIPDFIDDLEDFQNIFQAGISQVPLLPIDVSDGELTLSDVFTMPSMAFFYNINAYYIGHRIEFGFNQVGPEYNALGSPFIQTDIREQYFSDRFYALENRLNFYLKWKRIEDGISVTEDNGITDKYDINVGFFPGPNLPIINFSIGIENRDNGIEPQYEPIVNVTTDPITGDTLSVETIDTQLYQPEETIANQYNLNLSTPFFYKYDHNLNLSIFLSDKRDLIDVEKYKQVNSGYYSPRSLTKSYNFNLRTRISNKMETSINYNYIYYDFGEGVYFSTQKIINSGTTLLIRPSKIFRSISCGLDYSFGKGASEFDQLSVNMGNKITLFENLILNLDFNYKYKWVDDSSYDNYSAMMNLQYKF